MSAPRLRFDELEAIAFAGIGEIEILLECAVPGEERCRGRAQSEVELPYDDLVEIAVVDPELLAIADDQLLERRFIGPSKFSRALETVA